MDYINYCEEPAFFMKIYNSISEDKRYEFERKFNEFKETFSEYYDNKLFNPKISFKDSYIIIEQDKVLICRIDLREDLSDKIIVSEDLLEDILHEFNTSHGLYVTDNLSDDGIKFKLDFDEICGEIERILE